MAVTVILKPKGQVPPASRDSMYQVTGGIKQQRISGPSPSSITFCPTPHRVESLGKNAGFDTGAGVDPSLAFLLQIPYGTSFHEGTDLSTRSSRHTTITTHSSSDLTTVWLAILTQFSFFVNGNAETLRSVFVAHEGKRELGIMDPLADRYSMKPGLMALLPPPLPTDTATSAIVMMGSMKEYFVYRLAGGCGLPKVTLEGEKKDWEDILRRLERLKKYGVQTIAWYHLLRPIISRFVAAYDDPTSKHNLDFWNKVAQSTGGEDYSPLCLSGWITAFCVFGQLGQWQGNAINASAKSLRNPQHLSASQFVATHLRPATPDTLPYLTLDDFPYPKIALSLIPFGYTYVDVKLDDHGQAFDTTFVAGSIGSHISSTMGTRDTLRPVPGWWYFIKGKVPMRLNDGWGEMFQDAMRRREAATASAQIPSQRASKRVSRVKQVSAKASTGKEAWP
ncbi:hypothetical protein JVU11DRAFT_10551 [Chiua virens]|nr:hypothetical protein JVU11DRAFT_10551 [Chiua virens]